jgi:ribose transport system substrate-binding protein
VNPVIHNTSRGRRGILARSAALGGALCLTFVMAACGGSATSSPAPVASATPAPVASASAAPSPTMSANDLTQYIGKPDKALCGGREFTFGYNTFSDTEEFAVQFWNGIQKVAADLGCVKVNKLSDNIDAAQAVQNAKIFVQQKVDGVILFNVLDAAGPGIAQVLQPAGIPAVSIVVPMPGETFVTNDDTVSGTEAGTGLGQGFIDSGRTGDVYAIIGRFDGQGATGKARMDGVVAGLKATVPQATLLQFETAADPVKAQSGAAALLGKVPAGANILLIAINDQNTNAMLQAVKQAGRQADTLVASLGAVNPGGLQFMCQNPEYVGADAFFPENWPTYIIPALMARIQGATNVPEKIIVPTKFIKTSEIATIYPDFKCAK